MNAIENREIDVQDLSERRIKVLLVYFLHDYDYFLCVTKIHFNMLRFWVEILIIFFFIFKVSPSSSPRHVSYDHFQNSIGNGQFCTNTQWVNTSKNVKFLSILPSSLSTKYIFLFFSPVFSEVSNISGSGGHGLGGGNNGPSSWQDSSSNQTDFHLTSAVSAAAAAMALSPSHLGYINQDTSYHQVKILLIDFQICFII